MLRASRAQPLPTGARAWLVLSIASATRGRWQATLDGVVSLCWHLHAGGPGPWETWICAECASGVTANGQEGDMGMWLQAV